MPKSQMLSVCRNLLLFLFGSTIKANFSRHLLAKPLFFFCCCCWLKLWLNRSFFAAPYFHSLVLIIWWFFFCHRRATLNTLAIFLEIKCFFCLNNIIKMWAILMCYGWCCFAYAHSSYGVAVCVCHRC